MKKKNSYLVIVLTAVCWIKIIFEAVQWMNDYILVKIKICIVQIN